MIGTKDKGNVKYTQTGGVISKDEHERHLAPKKEWVWILCRQSSETHNYTAPSQNRYIFFKGQKRLIKDKRDIEHFKNNPRFLELNENDEVVVTKTPGKPTNQNPIPSPKVEVEIRRTSKRGRPKKTEVIK